MMRFTSEVDTSQGAIQATGRNTDYAISGDGFFVLEDNNGNLYYTRDGEFNIDPSGMLATGDGLRVGEPLGQAAEGVGHAAAQRRHAQHGGRGDAGATRRRSQP